MTKHRLFSLWSIIPCLLLQPLCAAVKPIKLAEIAQELGFKNWYVPTIVPRNIFDADATIIGIGGLNLGLSNDANSDRFISGHANAIRTAPITPFFVAGAGIYCETEHLKLRLSRELIKSNGLTDLKDLISQLKPEKVKIEKVKEEQWSQSSAGLRGEVFWNAYRDLSFTGNIQWALSNDLTGSKTLQDYRELLDNLLPKKLKVSIGGLYQLSSLCQVDVSLRYVLPFGSKFEDNGQKYQIEFRPDLSLCVGLRLSYI